MPFEMNAHIVRYECAYRTLRDREAAILHNFVLGLNLLYLRKQVSKISCIYETVMINGMFFKQSCTSFLPVCPVVISRVARYTPFFNRYILEQYLLLVDYQLSTL